MSDTPPHDSPAAPHREPVMVRDIGLLQATSLNVANMVGVGPFITIPLFVASMGGPQALVGWIVAAVLVLCDGLVWSELGAALPGSGGSYHFLQVIYGRYRGGRLVAFLFIWQFLISGTLELASGYIGAADYLSYAVRDYAPKIDATLAEWDLLQPDGSWLTQTVTGRNICAALAAIVVSILLCRNIRSLAWVAVVLCAGTLVTTFIVIAAGFANFDSSLLVFPPDAFRMDAGFFSGLGGAMLIAIYDYLGYYNVCHMGDEVKNPEKNIPRAVILSVLIVVAIYLSMNIAILGVVPTEQLMKSKNIAADFMEILFGRRVAVGFTFFIISAALASVFVMTLGYSRILYAAARNGDFFRVFGYLNPRGRYPTVALLSLGILTGAFCFLKLQTVIEAAVIVRIFVQFLGQILGLHLLRTTRPDVKLPFRMFLYPLPSLIAVVGWVFLLVAQNQYLPPALFVLVSGAIAYPVWRAFQSAAGGQPPTPAAGPV